MTVCTLAYYRYSDWLATAEKVLERYLSLRAERGRVNCEGAPCVSFATDCCQGKGPRLIEEGG